MTTAIDLNLRRFIPSEVFRVSFAIDARAASASPRKPESRAIPNRRSFEFWRWRAVLAKEVHPRGSCRNHCLRSRVCLTLLFNPNGDFRGACVKRVFYQFFDCRSAIFYHFASRDLVDDEIWEEHNFWHIDECSKHLAEKKC